jgi:hypothetical protein
MGVGRIAVLLAAIAVTGATAADARGSPFFLFEPTAAKPGDVVAVRTGGAVAQRPIRLYLIPNGLARDVRSRFHPSAHFVGTLRPDARGRGLLRFTVPPLDSDSYTLGAWRRTFSVVRPRRLLRVTAPPAEPCPVTIPGGGAPPGLRQRGDYLGNGALWARVPRDRVFRFDPRRAHADGSVGTKLTWLAAGVTGTLVAEAQRLDMAAPVRRAEGIRGQVSGFRGSAAWATRTSFSGEGCWKITGRVRDISLSFVVKVVIRSTS